MTYNLFIDDERDPVITDERTSWFIARNVDEVNEIISSMGWPNYISFPESLNGDENTGFEFARYMIAAHNEGQEVFTENFAYQFHGQDLVMANKIRYMIDNFLKVIRN